MLNINILKSILFFFLKFGEEVWGEEQEKKRHPSNLQIQSIKNIKEKAQNRACLQQSLQSKTCRQQTNHFPQTAAKYTLPMSNHTFVCRGEEEGKNNWWKTASHVKTFMKGLHSPLLPSRPSGQVSIHFILPQVYLKNKPMIWSTKNSSRLLKNQTGKKLQKALEAYAV